MEEELVLKRFPPEKQEQVRQLIAYAQLMGLDGKDLVSIGGKLNRMRQAGERDRNLEIIRSFDVQPIGTDAKAKGFYREDLMDSRFKIKTSTGAYNFSYDFGNWRIRSLKTGAIVRHNIDIYAYELGSPSWGRRYRYAVILDVAHGKLQLNF